jgi:hypothetical protein
MNIKHNKYREKVSDFSSFIKEQKLKSFTAKVAKSALSAEKRLSFRLMVIILSFFCTIYGCKKKRSGTAEKRFGANNASRFDGNSRQGAGFAKLDSVFGCHQLHREAIGYQREWICERDERSGRNHLHRCRINLRYDLLLRGIGG